MRKLATIALALLLAACGQTVPEWYAFIPEMKGSERVEETVAIHGAWIVADIREDPFYPGHLEATAVSLAANHDSMAFGFMCNNAEP